MTCRLGYPDEIQQLWERLRADWEALRDDPYALLKLRIESAGMSGIALDFPPESE
jgi:hypothetical protein